MAAPVTTRASSSDAPDLRLRPRKRRRSAGVVTAVLVLTSLSLMLLDVRGGPTDALRGLAAAVGGPLQSASSGLLGSAVDQVRRPDVEALRREVDRLSAENDRLALANQLLAEQFAAAAGDRALQDFATGLQGRTLTARVVAATGAPAQSGVTLDVGSAAGVRPDSAVLVPAGLVGRVIQVGPATSTVQLVSSPDSAVAVRMQRSRETGLAQGNGDAHSLDLRHVDPLATVQPGDAVVTLGSPGNTPFPPGLPVGTVTDAGTVGDVNRSIAVTPAADLTVLDRVVVLVAADDRAAVGADS